MSSFDDEHLIGAQLAQAALARAKYIAIGVVVLVLAWNSLIEEADLQRALPIIRIGIERCDVVEIQPLLIWDQRHVRLEPHAE